MVSKYNFNSYNVIPTYLSKYVIDYTMIVSKTLFTPIVGREEELNKSWFYLSQAEKNNLFLVGDIDTGKSAIAQEIIRQITTGECPKTFYDKRVLDFNFGELFDIKLDRKYKRVIEIIKYFLQRNKDYLMLYVDDSLYIKTDKELIKLLHQIITTYNIPIIICSRIKEYEDLYEEDYFIKKHENVVFVKEPEYKEIIPIVQSNISYIQSKYRVNIPEKMVKLAVYTSSLLNSFSCNPGRSLDILEKSAMYAMLNGKTEIDKKCILNCYDSQYKLFNAMSDSEKRRIAYHEAGHFLTLVKSYYSESERTACISILPTLNFLGANIVYQVLEKSLDANRKIMIDRIATYLGGRVAEKEITNVFSAGAASDLDAANTIAEKMLMQYGLSEGDNKNRSFIVDGYYVKDYLLTNRDKEKIKKEIRSIIKEAYKKAQQIIRENRKLLDIIAERLFKEYILIEEDLESIISEYEKTK